MIGQETFSQAGDSEVYSLWKLTLNLGTNELAWFSCDCHKCNLSVRYAIKNWKTSSKIDLDM